MAPLKRDSAKEIRMALATKSVYLKRPKLSREGIELRRSASGELQWIFRSLESSSRAADTLPSSKSASGKTKKRPVKKKK